MGWYAQKVNINQFLRTMSKDSYCFRIDTEEYKELILSTPIPEFYQTNCIYNDYHPNISENIVTIPVENFYRNKLLKIF